MDPKLKLKPIELIDIGIDKHTKIPIPILNTNIVVTYDETDTFEVEIKDINNNIDNIILVDGLTIELVKLRYNWVLNANVKNCIIGEDSYGLVWYSGEWLCGEWIDGTWYSGIWHDGVWKNGKFYSYLIDKAMIISNRFVILDKENIYSEFRSGTWMTGDFYNGTFGYDPNLKNDASYEDLNARNFTSAYWEDGRYHDGIFKKSVWFNGLFYNGEMESSYWMKGKFYNGTFYFHNPQGPYNWYDGSWYGGDFIEGNWKNGTFDQINKEIKSRFGTASAKDAYTIWWDGRFLNGEFHSGLNLDASGNTLHSISDGLTQWMSGGFYNGKWYGGYFLSGTFYNGEWFSGIFNSTTGETARNYCIWERGTWYTGLWINGIWKGGHFYSGLWLDGLFLNGYLSTNSIENIVEPQKLFNDVVNPTVKAISINNITYNSATFIGEVTNDGGGHILDRGVCWSTNNDFDINLNDGVISDQGSMGNMSITINNLSYDTLYNVKAYAINETGISYSIITGFTTSAVIDGAPSVVTLDPTNIIHDGAQLIGRVNSSSTGAISESGFYYSSTHTIPDEDDTLEPNINTTLGIDYMSEISSGLTENTLYYVRAYAINAIGIGFGGVKTFTTSINTTPVAPTIVFAPTNSNLTIENNWFEVIGTDTASARGNVTSNGNAFVTEMGACFVKDSESHLPTIDDNIVFILGSTGYFYIDITGLNSGESYKVRLFATNDNHLTGYSDMHVITTNLVTTAPTVSVISVVDNTP